MGIGILYILLGVLFTGAAAFNGRDAGWDTLTIIYAVIAIIDFAAGIKHIKKHRANKK